MGLIGVSVILRIAVMVDRCMGIPFGDVGGAREGQGRKKQRQNQQPRQQQTAVKGETIPDCFTVTQRDAPLYEFNISSM